MKKSLLTFLIVSLIISIILLTGCNNNTKNTTKENKTETTITTNKDIENKVFTALELNESSNKNSSIVTKIIKDKYLFKQGKSDYVIVIPDVIENSEGTAADEIVYFLKMSTGYIFKVINESELTAGQKYISIGNTNVFLKQKINIDDDLFRRSGFRIDTIKDNIYISASSIKSSLGLIYGAYQLLEILVNYKCYTEDEIRIENRKYIELVDFNCQYIPNIEARSINYGSIISDSTYRQRLRTLERFGSTEWATNGHSMLSILPTRKYIDEHPDWYSQTKTELCLSNEDMKKEFIKNVIEYLNEYEDAIYMCIAMMDDHDYCQCDNCKVYYEKYGGALNGGVSGLCVKFVNDVADAVKEYINEYMPGREMTLITYAYNQTFVSPTVYDETTNTYKAVHEEVIPHDNVSIMFCPITQDYYYAIDDKKNETISKSYLGWTSICDNVSVYEYSTNFVWYEINFYNFNSIADDIKFYANKHVSYYFEQTSGATSTPCFEELRIYTEAELLWNPNQDYNALVEDFFNNYFKDASEPMFKYLSDLRTWYEILHERGVNVGAIYQNLCKADYWPLQVLKSFLKDIDEAFQSIEYLKNENESLYNILWNRINKERLSVLYLICNLYKAYYSAIEYDEMVDDLEYYGGLYSISKEGESAASYTDMISRLRGN